MEQWNMSQVTADITTVPGIGPAAATKLRVADEDDYGAVENTYQLFGKWLDFHALKDDDEFTDEPDANFTNQKFWYWLKAKGINSQRSAIVKAVSDKLGSYMPALRPSADDDDDE